MIETIYNVEKGESTKADVNIRLPKNIRQIGQSDKNTNCQIYIEENVLAYIEQKSEDEEKIKYGVFLGDKKQGNGYTYIFINGIIEVDGIIENTIIFSEDIWTSIYDDMKRYYKNSIILGWYSYNDGGVPGNIHKIEKIHLDNFAGNGKVYFAIDKEDEDDAFYIYERNQLKRQPCYHVYFEKSYEFEDYIFGRGKGMAKKVENNQATKDNGKYGIAINNLRAEKKAEEKDDKSEIKQPSTYKVRKLASVASILLLAGVIASMGRNGQLDSLTGRIQGLAQSILNKEEPTTEGFISVNGNPSNGTTNQSEETSTEETSTEETSTEETSTEEASTKETSSEETSLKETTSGNAEEQTTKKTEATVSLPNENYEVHIVKAGETLYSILIDKYGSIANMEEVKDINKLTDEDYVMEGQKIFLP